MRSKKEIRSLSARAVSVARDLGEVYGLLDAPLDPLDGDARACRPEDQEDDQHHVRGTDGPSYLLQSFESECSRAVGSISKISTASRGSSASGSGAYSNVGGRTRSRAG